MQDLILIFSTCQKRNGNSYQFHFKGFYSGKSIKKLTVYALNGDVLGVNNNYLLWVQKIDIINTDLQVKLIKYKKIF